MLKISNFNIDYTIKSVRDRIAAAKLKIKKRRFLWAISILNEAIFEIKHICESHPKEYQNLLRKIYETIGDSYFALKKSDLAFDCYLAAYHLKNNLVLNKILFISQIYGQYLSSENAMLGFLLLLSSKNSFPGSRKDNEEFAKKIIDLTSSMALEFQLYADIYLSRQLTEDSLFDNMVREEELENCAIAKYGFDSVSGALKNFYSHSTTQTIRNYLNVSLVKSYEKFITSDVLLNSNLNIYDEYEYRPIEDRVRRLDCTKDYFWRDVNPEILYRIINEDINFKFKYASFINSLIGHPEVLQEIEDRVGLYSNYFLSLDGKKFDILFNHPFNVYKVRAIYSKLPIS